MFKIYLDRLQNDSVQKIELTADPAFLEIAEEELRFEEPISISGEANLASDYLIIRLNIKTSCREICRICNTLAKREILLKNVCFSIDCAEIKGAVFDFSPLVKEAILLDVPAYYECNFGNCKERRNIEQFIKKPAKENTYFPFSNLKSSGD